MDEPHVEKAPPPEPAAPAQLLQRGKCGGCNKDIVWACRPNGSKVPLDPVAVCFVVTRRNGEPFATTFKEFREKVVAINVKGADGQIATHPIESLLGMMVTHFATCPKARDFSRKLQPRK